MKLCCGGKIISVYIANSPQLLEHMYHVMHIRLPDRLNVVNHFCLQAFLLEQSFSSLSMPCCSSTTVILLFSNPQLVSCHLELHYGCWCRLELHSGFFLPVGLVYDIDYLPLQRFNWYLLSQRGVQFQISYHWSSQQIFRRIFVTSGQTSSDPKYNPLFRPCSNFCVIFFFAIVNTIRYSVIPIYYHNR